MIVMLVMLNLGVGIWWAVRPSERAEVAATTARADAPTLRLLKATFDQCQCGAFAARYQRMIGVIGELRVFPACRRQLHSACMQGRAHQGW